MNFSILNGHHFFIACQRYWSLNSWSNHPFSKSLRPYNPTWTSLAADVETEFRRIDKICLQTSPLRLKLLLASLPIFSFLSSFPPLDSSWILHLPSFLPWQFCRKVVVTDNWILTIGAWPWSLHIRFGTFV